MGWTDAAMGGMGILYGELTRERSKRDQREANEHAAKLNYEYGEMAADNADARARAFYTDFNSPAAKVRQLQEAGLSTALMYSGGGGVGGSAAATTASQGSGAGGQQGKTPESAMQGAQLGLMLAQIRNLNEDSEKKKVEANKLAGVDTQALQQSIEESKYRVNKLITEVGNNMLDAANKQLQNTFDAMRNEIQQKTKNFQINTVKEQWFNAMAQTDKLTSETAGLNIENSVKFRLLNAQLENIEKNTANLIAMTLQTQAQTNLTELDIKNYQTKIENILADTKLKTDEDRIKAVQAAASELIGQPIGTSGAIGEVIKMFVTAFGQTKQNVSRELEKLFGKN